MTNILLFFGTLLVASTIIHRVFNDSDSNNLIQRFKSALEIHRPELNTAPDRFYHALYVLGWIWLISSIPARFIDVNIVNYLSSDNYSPQKVVSIYEFAKSLFLVFSFYLVIMHHIKPNKE